MPTLDDLADAPVWVAWRNEDRDGRPAKVPYAPNGVRAKADDPETWGSRTAAEARARRIVNGAGGGVGIILGTDCGDGTVLGGIDLDTCRSPDGQFEGWATGLIDRFGGYSEISPSGTGAKVFFRYREADQPRLREMMGTRHGKMFKRRTGGDHPPAIELHLSNRYFAVTGDAVGDADLRLVEFADLKWLLTEAGPAFVGNDSAGRDGLGGHRPRDESRSGAAFRLAGRIRRAGKTFDEFCNACRTDPETASWYAEKGTAADDRELHRAWEHAGQSDDAAGLPTIRLVAGERPHIVLEAIDALDRADVALYRRGLSIVSVATIPARAADGAEITTPAIVSVPQQQLAYELGKAARWLKYDGRRKDWVPVDVPPDVPGNIAALPNKWRFPSLSGVIGTPTMRPDGSLLSMSGYDRATGFLLIDPPPMPPIRDRPTEDEVRRALRRLNRLLAEFPFAFAEGHTRENNPSRSVALSMLMTPVLRPALPPAIPLHAVCAPAGGTGKSYLADLVSVVATGERCPVITRSPGVEETEKRLVGAVLTGQPIISIDNCNGELRSEFLCQAVERPLLQVRALGTSDLARVVNSITCFVNGNNIVIAEDLVRRTILCRLDAEMERPETRIFRSNPLSLVLENRGLYVGAILTIARAYIVAGKPNRPTPFASFDRWSELVRGSLIWLGCADPVETVTDLAVADPIRNERAEVFAAIAEVEPTKAEGHSVSEIIAAAKEGVGRGTDRLMNALMAVAGADGEINPKRLGKWLAASQNAIAGGFKLLRNDTDKSRLKWQLAQVRG